jgi:hypothetical protein
VRIEPKVVHPQHVQFSTRLTSVPLGIGLPDPEDIEEELLGYCDVLLGRVASPVSSPYLDLAEVASAYYARAQELDALIHREERRGTVHRGSPLYRTRTGALRSFLEMSKMMASLGSRRLSEQRLIFDERLDAGDIT